jgi:hypothetical protein
MKFYRIYISLFILFLVPTFLLGQNGFKIEGVVQDSSGTPKADIVVSLIKSSNAKLIQTALTENDGAFEFIVYTPDSFKVVVQSQGFKPYISSVFAIDSTHLVKHLEAIRLNSSINQLQEVSVVAKIPIIERKADRTIVNPEAMISAAGTNALDALAKAPGVMVDQDGNIKLKGKSGVLVLIDDKPTYLSGDALANFLRSLPAASVKQFELMPNPPAQYEAAGNSGIINIKTKRTLLKGWNGNISLNYGQGRYARSNNNLQLNYSSKKISFFSGLSYGLTNRFHDLTIHRRYKKEDESTKSVFTQNTYIKNNATSYNARVGLDYYLTPKTTLGISVKGLFNKDRVSKYNYATLLDSSLSLAQIVIADNKDKSGLTNFSGNTNLRHQFDSSGTSITCDADYLKYNLLFNQQFQNYIDLPNGTNLYTDRQDGNSPQKISIYTFKSDFVKSLANQGKFETGIKAAFTQTDNDADYTKTQNELTVPNYSLSNRFLYDEWINAAYINYTKSYSRWDIQAGLRFESTLITGKQLGNPIVAASAFNRDYHSVFPTAFISYKLDSAANNVLNASYGRRIDRAFYKDLNPFVSPLDQYTYYSGNPFIQPTFAHEISLSYSYKTFFNSGFSYSQVNNKIQETIEINNGIYYSRSGNIGSSEVYNFFIESTLPVRKWWTAIIYSEIVYAEYRSKLYTETLNSKGTYFYASLNNNFQFEKGWSAELSGTYLSNVVDSQFEFGDYGQAAIGLQKRILKNKGSLKVSVSDVLYSFRIRGTINNLQLTDAGWNSLRDSRVVSCTFSYRFGKNTSSKPSHNANGAESEQKRVKTS